ncbi:hypothetical protein DV738_g3744, partial [Chaetothyriales sp. CBS 135597]
MTSLFNRRTRSASAQRPPYTPASNSAHAAATQAFLASSPQTAKLSASAAAAALRTMSPPPTPVGDLQTKRMVRRSSSVSAINAVRGRGRGRGRGGGLERADSTGSMSERTFRRSPSPGRPVAPPVDPQPAPPVPKLPDQLPAKTHRRAASLDPAPLRVTSSPAAIRPATRGSSVQPIQRHHNAQTAAAVLVTQQQRLAALQNQDNRSSSINFSRPLSPPPAQPPPTNRSSSRTPAASNAISPAEPSVRSASQQPAKKPKKKVAPQPAPGSHLAANHLESPLSASPVPTLDSDSDSTPEKTRRQMRASGALAKQPSIVREDWEGEQQQEREMSVTHQKGAVGETPILAQGRKQLTAANVSRKLGEPITPTAAHVGNQLRPRSQNRAALASEQGPVRRVASMSPTRGAHFPDRLTSDLAAGQKHDPLPRAVSPAKSALKQTSSPIGTLGVETRPRGSSLAASDASDSNRSIDGGFRPKKSVRVSFEPSVETIGVAAGPVEPDSPQQYTEEGTKRISGSNRSGLDDNVEHIEPRPQLPSFGSVRGKARRTDSSDAVEPQRPTHLILPRTVTSASASSSERSSSSVSQASVESGSSDHAIGAVFAQEAQRNGQAGSFRSERTPRESTQVDKHGFVSPAVNDTSADSHRRLDQANPSPYASVRQSSVVPALAVYPPSPDSEPTNPADQWALDVPGGFPVSSDDLSRVPVTPPPRLNGLGTRHGPTTATDEDSDHDSIYSDAEEDLSDRDEHGFASIDAVIESPIVGAAITPPASPLPDRAQGPRSPAWEAAQERWSGIAKQSRQAQTVEPNEPIQPTRSTQPGKPRQHLQQTSHESARSSSKQPVQPAQPTPAVAPKAPQVSQPAVTITKKKKKKPSSAAIAASAAAAITTANPSGATTRAPRQTVKIQASPSAPPVSPSDPVVSTAKAPVKLRPALKQTAPVQSEPVPIRSSMRAQATPPRDPNFRHSMRPSSAAPTTEPRVRPKSMVDTPSSPPSQQRVALQKKNVPSAAVYRSASSRPAIRIDNDSDSESSFRKSRKRRARSSTGAYSMRRSMRANAPERPSQSERRGVARSLSPPRRRAMSSQPETKAFRSSMRGSEEQPSQQLRRSASMFGASLLRPVRGIPRRNDEGDSTDLEDSDDEPKHKVDAPVPTSSSPQVTNHSTGKKGLLSIFRSKKKDDDSSKHDDEDNWDAENQANGDEVSSLGFGSVAEREALVAQTMARLEASKQVNGYHGTPNGNHGTIGRSRSSTLAPVPEYESGPPPPVHGRLQRRISMSNQDSWPLKDADRPSTSDGLLRTNGSPIEPDGLDRVSSSETVPTALGRGGKKKRFPMLRKAFGLKD